MHRFTPLDWASWGLTTVGALNWGLVGFADFSLVRTLFGGSPLAQRLVYGLIGLSGVWSLYRYWQMRRVETPLERLGLAR